MGRLPSNTLNGANFSISSWDKPDLFNSDLASSIINVENETEKSALVKQALDLARLSQGLLKGEELTAFVKRSFENLK